ncbi:MAG TPA: SpoIIE family protein phosphatase [Roseiflexaceae bacterium]|nr:SpoIIE family protein phosphatase [Roseiflexaceae bacterium]
MENTPETIVDRVPLFASVPAGERETLLASIRRGMYPAGQVLFYEGERGDWLYVILSGQVEIVKALGTPDERLLGVRASGDFIGEMSLINPDSLRTASARMRTPARLLELTRPEFDTILRRYPAVAYEMLRVLSTRLRSSHDTAIRDLHARNERLAQAYAELQAAQARIIEQETLVRELALAREIQESMLPARLPHLEGLDVGARMLPARMVGGDFFDVIRLDEDSLGLAVGDVSGKGAPAALFMALASSLLRAEVTRGAAPEEAVEVLNRHLMARNSRGMFVTLLYGVLRRTSRMFHYVRAGHELPIAWDASGAHIAVAQGRGTPLGMFARPALDVQSLALPPGATLLLASDGAHEAMDEQGTLLGHERLFELARAAPARSAQELCNYLVQAVIAHHGAAPQSDDITIVVVRT